MIDVEIKYATKDDLDVCHVFDKYNTNEVLLEKIQRDMVILAWLDKSCAGYLRWDWFWNRLPYLSLIQVNAQERNKGVGFKLINNWQQTLKEQNFDFILSSSQKNEPSAINWHLRQGFQQIGQLSSLNEDGSEEIFMRKELI